jgi:hypothetical protein
MAQHTNIYVLLLIKKTSFLPALFPASSAVSLLLGCTPCKLLVTDVSGQPIGPKTSVTYYQPGYLIFEDCVKDLGKAKFSLFFRLALTICPF